MEEQSLDIPTAQRFQSAAGKGVPADVEASTIHIGNRSCFGTVLEDAAIGGIEPGLDQLQTLETEEKAGVIVARERRGDVTVLGWLAFTDTVRPGAAKMIDDLRSFGVEHIAMLTGDNERVAQRIADEVGVNVETAMQHGRPAETIVAYADEYDADLLVLGTKRRPDEYRVLLGSVTGRVLRLTTRPATVVKTEVSE